MTFSLPLYTRRAPETQARRNDAAKPHLPIPLHPLGHPTPGLHCPEQSLDFLRGNIIKYILRFDAKDGLQDLEKARTYLERLIALEKSKPGKTDNHNNMENENHGKSKGCYLHLQGAFPFPRD